MPTVVFFSESFAPENEDSSGLHITKILKLHKPFWIGYILSILNCVLCNTTIYIMNDNHDKMVWRGSERQREAEKRQLMLVIYQTSPVASPRPLARLARRYPQAEVKHIRTERLTTNKDRLHSQACHPQKLNFVF